MINIKKYKINSLAKKAIQKYQYLTLSKSVNSGNIIGRHRLNVQIQTVSNCNGKCIFCPYLGSWHQKNPGKMDWDVYKKIIRNLKPFKISKFCPYLQNEPLLDKGLFKKIDYALKRLDIQKVEISTNLAFLNDTILKQLVKSLSPIKHEIWISFHGVDEPTYEQIMGLDFNKSFNNIMHLVETSQKEPLNIIIRGAGMPKKRLNNLKSWFGRRDYFEFWDKQLRKFKNKPEIRFITYHDRAGSEQLKNKNMSFNHIFNDNLNGFYCVRFDRWLHFLYTGEPIFCCMDYSRETAFGETVNENTIDAIYNSEHFRTLIKQGLGLQESEVNFICKRCVSPGG